ARHACWMQFVSVLLAVCQVRLTAAVGVRICQHIRRYRSSVVSQECLLTYVVFGGPFPSVVAPPLQQILHCRAVLDQDALMAGFRPASGRRPPEPSKAGLCSNSLHIRPSCRRGKLCRVLPNNLLTKIQIIALLKFKKGTHCQS